MSLRPYIAHDDEPNEMAVLVFANTAREARRLAWPYLQNFGAEEFTAVRAKRMRDSVPYLMTLAVKDASHVIDSPPVCKQCELWGGTPTDDGCTLCAELAP